MNTLSSSHFSDCDNCDALCCKIFSVKDEHWNSVKKYYEPCGNLTSEGVCNIYRDRADKALSVCIDFDCLGVWPTLSKWIKVKK